MTKQIPDKVLYMGQEFILAGLKGTGLFTPRDFGISREMMGIATACYRGYFCRYECIDNRLFLIWLGIILEEDVELPSIAGISAKSNNRHYRKLIGDADSRRQTQIFLSESAKISVYLRPKQTSWLITDKV